LLLAACALPAWGRQSLAPLKVQFALPDNQVDFGKAKLTIDHLIDPSTDTVTVERELDRWEQAIRANVPAGSNGRQTLDVLLETLYKPGPWNDGRPFTYDLNDPLGKKPANKRLATYLATRKGNCVSMPILVAILGQRLGLTITLSTAPEHILAKFADDSVQMWVNVEATSGGYLDDAGYARFNDISQKAIDNEIYLRPLFPHEVVGVMASTLMEYYAREKNADALMEVADLALTANPKDTVAMVWKANAYYLQIQQRYWAKYPNASDIPVDKVVDYQHLSQENLAWFNKAETLGWEQTTSQERSDYLQSIKHEKAKRGR